MKRTGRCFAVASLAVVMAGSIVGCSQAQGDGGRTKTESNRVSQYKTNGVTTNDQRGARPHGTQNSAAVHYSSGANTARYNTIGVRPHTTINNDRRVADRMAKLAGQVKGVTRATAIVNGNDAIVGIDGPDAASAKVREREVYQALRNSEPTYNIHVTSDRNLHQRIRTLNTQMTAGHPVRDVAIDIRMLIRDMGRTITAPFR